MGAFDDFLQETVQTGTDHLSRADWAERHFLNPKVPEAVQDDPTGEHHAEMQVTTPEGEPMKGLSKGDPIPLRLRPYQRESMDSGRLRRIHRWGRRCMVPGTPVLMADGSWKAIEDVEKGEEVMTRSSDGDLEPQTVTLEHDNGVKDVYEVTLRNNRSITCTANHPFLRCANYRGTYKRPDDYGSNEYEWASLEDGLEEGDNILCYGSAPEGLGDLHEPEFGTILGYMLTDGYMNGEAQTPKFTTTDASMAYDFSASVLEEFGFPGKWRVDEDPSRGDRTRYDIYLTDGYHGPGTPAKDRFKQIGIWGLKSRRKKLPDRAWKWDRETAFAFLSAMISGDGSIYVRQRDDRAPATAVTVACSNSKDMLEQTRLLLTRLGISSKVKTETRTTNRSNGEATIHYLNVADTDSLRLLLEETGPVTGKEEKYYECLDALTEKSNSRYVRTPDGQWMHARVKSIEHKGTSPTYDIGVEENHNYIADGICVHNTGKTFQIGVEVVTEALRDPNGQILIMAPAQNQVKVIFDDYIRPLLRQYRHRNSGKIGIGTDPAEIGNTADFAITTDTKKPQEIVIKGEDGHKASIRGMVVSDSARGQSASFIVLDEADYADSDQIKQIVGPILMTQPNTRMLMVSTPSGQADTFFRNRWDSDNWWTSHQTFKVLPHYDQELHDRMAEMAGGSDTNTFKREYLAKWGSRTEGVFDEEALAKNFIISPYPLVMETANRNEGSRSAAIAADKTRRERSELAYFDGVRPMDHNVYRHPIGAQSTYRPQYRGTGVVTAGTDWNSVAGMQTVIIWWPPPELIERGEITVSRYDYQGTRPDATGRAKQPNGEPREFVVGSDNGDPGGPHDLTEVSGLVIWHGRLESGNFSWQSAANRVAAIMAIDRFVDTWYVDQGYGEQVNMMIKQIMETGEWIPDMRILNNARSVDAKALDNIRQFHPDNDPEITGKIYRPINFGDTYDHRDIDFSKGQGRYKDVMINLTKRMVAGRKLLFPHSELIGYHKDTNLGTRRGQSRIGDNGQVEEETTQVTDDDKLRENGADPQRGEDGFGGLVTQMQSTRVDGFTPTGRPRYKGDWHAVDGLMLSTLAFWEEHSEDFGGNMFRMSGDVPMKTTEDIFNAAAEATQSTGGVRSTEQGTSSHGPFDHKSYSDAEAPLQAILNGQKTPDEIGTSMNEMVQSAGQYWSAHDG